MKIKFIYILWNISKPLYTWKFHPRHWYFLIFSFTAGYPRKILFIDSEKQFILKRKKLSKDKQYFLKIYQEEIMKVCDEAPQICKEESRNLMLLTWQLWISTVGFLLLCKSDTIKVETSFINQLGKTLTNECAVKIDQNENRTKPQKIH